MIVASDRRSSVYLAITELRILKNCLVRSIRLYVLALLLAINMPLLTLVTPANAQSDGELMFILDASSSMLATDGGSTTRIDKAKAALSSTLDSIPSETRAGLRAYGSVVPDTDKENGCQDSKLYNAPKANNAAAIKSSVNSIQAKGWTLMGKSLQDVQSDFVGEGPKSVILLSDGIDRCSPPDACEVAKTLRAGGVDIKVNTLGLLVDNAARAQLTCIAENSGGNYYDINDIDKLGATLAALTKREVSLFSAQGTPIEGSLRIEEAPLLLSDTFYTDTLIVPQERHYGFELLPEQKATFTVKAVNRDTDLDTRFDYLRVTAYKQSTAEVIRQGAIVGESERLSGSGVTTLAYEIDAEKLDISEPTFVSFGVRITDADDKSGTALPLEIKVVTEGGKAPDNKSAEEAGATENSDDTSELSPLIIVLLTLLGVAVLAGTAYGVWRLLKARRNRANSLPSASEATDETSSTNFPKQ